MLMLKNELVSSLLMSSIVTILVLMNVPTSAYSDENYKKRPLNIGIKSFILAFITTFSLFYFISDAPTTNVMSNIFVGEPDF